MVKISVASLGADEHGQSKGHVRPDGERAGPPDPRVSDQVDLLVVLDPKVLQRRAR